MDITIKAILKNVAQTGPATYTVTVTYFNPDADWVCDDIMTVHSYTFPTFNDFLQKIQDKKQEFANAYMVLAQAQSMVGQEI